MGRAKRGGSEISTGGRASSRRRRRLGRIPRPRRRLGLARPVGGRALLPAGVVHLVEGKGQRRPKQDPGGREAGVGLHARERGLDRGARGGRAGGGVEVGAAASGAPVAGRKRAVFRPGCLRLGEHRVSVRADRVVLEIQRPEVGGFGSSGRGGGGGRIEGSLRRYTPPFLERPDRFPLALGYQNLEFRDLKQQS